MSPIQSRISKTRASPLFSPLQRGRDRGSKFRDLCENEKMAGGESWKVCVWQCQTCVKRRLDMLRLQFHFKFVIFRKVFRIWFDEIFTLLFPVFCKINKRKEVRTQFWEIWPCAFFSEIMFLYTPVMSAQRDLAVKFPLRTWKLASQSHGGHFPDFPKPENA